MLILNFQFVSPCYVSVQFQLVDNHCSSLLGSELLVYHSVVNTIDNTWITR